MGYSNRSLFTNDKIVSALKEVANRDIDFKIIFCNPDAEISKIRSKESLYGGTDLLINDIRDSINHYYEFVSSLVNVNKCKFSMRITDNILYNSFFIVDDFCYFSLYNRVKSGSTGPCYIYKKTNVSINYYNICYQDFKLIWENAKSFKGESDV